jgi:DNA-binding SARP family transcriptional activator
MRGTRTGTGRERSIDGKQDQAGRSELTRLLSRGAYEELGQLLGELHAATPRDNPTLATILGAAHQICLVCEQYREDLKSHLLFHEEAIRREAEMQRRLEGILHILNTSRRTSEVPPHMLAMLSNNGVALKPPETGSASGKIPENALSTARSESNESRLPVDAQGEVARDTESVPAAPTSLPAAQQHVPSLSAYCLGIFSVYSDEGAVQEWPSRKAKSILKFLLTHRQRPINKDVLMDLFWPDADPYAARNSLNVAMSSLRHTLRDDHPDFKYVLFHDDCYHMNPQIQIWVDAEAFMLALEKARQFERQGNIEAALGEYQAAEDLYQGPFLEEERYEDWPRSKRQALQENYLEVLNRLGEFYLGRSLYGPCANVCRKLLDIDNCREDIHRRLMRCYSRHGQRHLALRQYHLCADALRDELDLVPSEDTTKVYTAIRQNVST